MSTTTKSKRATTTLERTYEATLDEVWPLWTTKEGIESWWGPEGFAVTVQELELRPGGKLLYTMTAVAEPQVAFMKRANMPLATHARITILSVEAPQRLVYDHHADFIPGVEPYATETIVELEARPEGQVHMRLTLEAMHDATWTERATMGWKSEIEKLVAALAARRRHSP